MENETLNLGQLGYCEIRKGAHEASLYCLDWRPQDHQEQPLHIKPGQAVEVKFTVVDPLERMALFVLQSRDYIVYKKNCGPASLD